MKFDIKIKKHEFILKIDVEKLSGPDVDGKEAYAAVRGALVDSPEVDEVLKEVAGDQYYAAFEYTTPDFCDVTARKMAAAYAEGGLQKVYEEIDVHDIERSAYEYYENVGGADDVKSFVDAILEQVKAKLDAEGIDTSIIGADEDGTLKGELQETFREVVVEYMEESDKSSLIDAIPPHTKVEVSFIPGYQDLYIDDLFTAHHDVVFEPETAFPDANLMRILSFLNVAPSEFVRDVMKERGIDLTVPQVADRHSDFRRKDEERKAHLWRAILDVEAGRTDNVSTLELRDDYERNAWNSTVDAFRDKKDYDRPRVYDGPMLITVMENASYGGVGAWVARLPLKELLEGKFSQPFLARGGQTGIHDYINGSGHIESPQNPVLIDLSEGSFRAGRNERKDEVDDVYGFVPSCLEPDVETYVKPDWHRAAPYRWIRRHDEGIAEVVSETDGSQGPFEIRFKDGDGDEVSNPVGNFRYLEEAFAAAKQTLETGIPNNGMRM